MPGEESLVNLDSTPAEIESHLGSEDVSSVMYSISDSNANSPTATGEDPADEFDTP